MSTDRNHARLGASNSHRWMNCAGSVTAEKSMPDRPSKYAEEGTAAHALATLCLTLHRPPEVWLGEEVEGVVVTTEMVEAVQFYLEYCAKFSGAQLWIEKKFDLSPIKPPADMFGTCDFGAYFADRHHVDIVDLKYGKGVTVEAEENPQTRYYALGFWIEFMVENRAEAEQIEIFTLHIVQPRQFDHEGMPRVTTETLTLTELRAWAKEQLLPAAHRALALEAPRTPGEWCRFCKAKAACAEFRGVALAAAQTEFTEIEAGTMRLPAPSEMTPDQIRKALDASHLLEEWLDGVRVFAQNEIERGRPIPGWALSPKRAMRKWKDEQEAVKHLTDGMGLAEGDLFEKKFRSPAQVEKLTGKKNFPAELVVAESSGMKLCRDTDPKAVLPSGPEFPDLPEPEQSSSQGR